MYSWQFMPKKLQSAIFSWYLSWSEMFPLSSFQSLSSTFILVPGYWCPVTTKLNGQYKYVRDIPKGSTLIFFHIKMTSILWRSWLLTTCWVYLHMSFSVIFRHLEINLLLDYFFVYMIILNNMRFWQKQGISKALF